MVTAAQQDLDLIQRCLDNDKHAWEDFVDCYLRIVLHVVQHTVRSRGIVISESDRDDLVAEVFLELCKNDKACLRHFRGDSGFSTYLTVVARRVIVSKLVKRVPLETTTPDPEPWNITAPVPQDEQLDQDLSELLDQLDETESKLIRLHHLEGLSYREISEQMGVRENSIGPALSRARAKLREAAEEGIQNRAA